MNSSGGKDWDKEQMRVMLVNTLMLLCKNGITFKRNIRVQGLLGITIDDDDIFLVQINENVENESSIALSDTVIVNPVKHALCTTSSSNNPFIDKSLQQLDEKQMIGTKVNAGTSSEEEEEYSCLEDMQSYEEERQHHVLNNCMTIVELKQENEQVLSNFEMLNSYSTNILTSRDAGVSGECNNQVNIKCEIEDFFDSPDQLTDDNSLQHNIKRQPQSDSMGPNLSSSTIADQLSFSNHDESFQQVTDAPSQSIEVKQRTKKTIKRRYDSGKIRKKTQKCTECEKAFPDITKLQRHVSSVHEGLRPHTCKECKKNFADKYSLSKHNNAVHTKEKFYMCPHCYRKFYYAHRLRDHMKAWHQTQS